MVCAWRGCGCRCKGAGDGGRWRGVVGGGGLVVILSPQHGITVGRCLHYFFTGIDARSKISSAPASRSSMPVRSAGSSRGLSLR